MKHSHVTEKIIGSFYEVYNELGHGFLESVYEEALIIVLKEKGLSVIQQHRLPVWFRHKKIADFVADLVIENAVLIELKAVRNLDSSHEAQLLNYLRATEIEVGLLLNFGLKAEMKRMVFDNQRKGICENPRLSAAILLSDE
jgi:GxxExxY protein